MQDSLPQPPVDVLKAPHIHFREQILGFLSIERSCWNG